MFLSLHWLQENWEPDLWLTSNKWCRALWDALGGGGPNLTLCFIPLSLLPISSLTFFHLFLLFISLKTSFNLFWHKGDISSYFHLLTSMLNSKIVLLVTCIFQTLSLYQHIRASKHPFNVLLYIILCQDLDHNCHFEYHYHYYNTYQPLHLQRSS